jgi:DNA repair protein RadC
MAITDWPSEERPREKLLLNGSSSLSDAELLAIFLRTGIKGVTAVGLARQLLKNFGSLRALLTASKTEFCTHKGLGNAKYAQLQAVLEMANRHLSEGMKRNDCLTDPAQTIAYLHSQLRDRQQEVFACVMLDNRNRVIIYREMFYGTIDGASVYPREVVKQALADNAASVIFAHNHPITLNHLINITIIYFIFIYTLKCTRKILSYHRFANFAYCSEKPALALRQHTR